jgi:hypothetical protein
MLPEADFLGSKLQLSAGDPGWIRTSDPQLRRLMLKQKTAENPVPCLAIFQ